MEDNRGGGAEPPNSPPGHRSVRVSPVLSGVIAVDLGAAAAPQPANDDAAAAAAAAAENGSRASKRAKNVSEVQMEIRELLDRKLVGNDAVKAEALQQLGGYFNQGDASYPQKEEHRRAVAEWDGCHLVLNVLRYELDHPGGPVQHVALPALSFLVAWNDGDNERRSVMSRFNGVEVVARAMDAFLQDREMQDHSVRCLYNFAGGSQAKYLQDIVDGDCVPRIVRAMEIALSEPGAQKYGIYLLERLRNIEGQDHSDLLIEQGALVAVAKAYATYKNSNDPDAQAIRVASRRLMSKFFG